MQYLHRGSSPWRAPGAATWPAPGRGRRGRCAQHRGRELSLESTSYGQPHRWPDMRRRTSDQGARRESLVLCGTARRQKPVQARARRSAARLRDCPAPPLRPEAQCIGKCLGQSILGGGNVARRGHDEKREPPRSCCAKQLRAVRGGLLAHSARRRWQHGVHFHRAILSRGRLRRPFERRIKASDLDDDIAAQLLLYIGIGSVPHLAFAVADTNGRRGVRRLQDVEAPPPNRRALRQGPRAWRRLRSVR